MHVLVVSSGSMFLTQSLTWPANRAASITLRRSGGKVARICAVLVTFNRPALLARFLGPINWSSQQLEAAE